MSPNHNPPQLFLIDGYALIYRAFFAMIARPLRTAKGENTSAALGIVNFLMRLREKLDNELQSDFDKAVHRIGQLLEAFGIPLITVPGYEADDVIGTLAATGS